MKMSLDVFFAINQTTEDARFEPYSETIQYMDYTLHVLPSHRGRKNLDLQHNPIYYNHEANIRGGGKTVHVVYLKTK